MGIYKKSVRLIGSNKFFYLIILLFLLESIWIAISSRYPMAFDEAFHLGIIQLHASQWSPFITNQAPLTSKYGALTTDPSYLYHYLMSWPWRLVNLLFKSDTYKIVSLRFIDIGLFAWGIILYRKLLLKVASPAITNASLLFFVLVPVVPLLAGQINYDNLVFLLTALTMLLAVNFSEKLKKNVVDIKLLILGFSISLLACLVKFAFLPILSAIALYFAYCLFKFATKPKHSFRKALKLNWNSLSQWRQIGLIVIFLVSVGLFIRSYGVNVIVYDNLVPQCNQVLSISECRSYGPWNRNYNDFLNNKNNDINPIKYTGGWIYGMYERLFFTINGPGNTANYTTVYPLPVIGITAAVFSIIGILLFIRFSKQILKKNNLLVFYLFVTFSYIAALWGRNYHDFVHLGQVVAVNGRYLVLILPVITVAIALGFQKLLASHTKLKFILIVMALLFFLEGGGPITYIYASNQNWYWPGNNLVQNINKSAQKVVKPWVITW